MNGLLLHAYVTPPDPAWGDFCWHITDEGEHCGWLADDHEPPSVT